MLVLFSSRRIFSILRSLKKINSYFLVILHLKKTPFNSTNLVTTKCNKIFKNYYCNIDININVMFLVPWLERN